MDIRLVAYRPATSSDTVNSSYELEFTKAPNISLNFQLKTLKLEKVILAKHLNCHLQNKIINSFKIGIM